MEPFKAQVGGRSGRVYIPRSVSPFVYDDFDKEDYLKTLNLHVALAKACLCQPFLTETYFVRTEEGFSERGIGTSGFAFKLKVKGEVIVDKAQVLGPVSGSRKQPVWSHFYFPVELDSCKMIELKGSAYAQVSSVQSLSNAFAKLYGLKSANEILAFAQSLERRLH